MGASLCCIGAIGGLASQTTSRLGNALGIVGVSSGIAATIATLSVPSPVLAQIGMLSVAGGSIGLYIARRVAITDLPQLVAAFHSLVGLAAVTTSISSYLQDYSHIIADPAGSVHKTTIFLGTFIGAVTFTGKN